MTTPPTETPPTTTATSTTNSEGPGESTLLTSPEPAGDGAETPKSGAPEAYADFNAPEGYSLDKDLIAEVSPILKELGLSQEQAQRLVDFHAKHSSDTVTKLQESNRATRTEWQRESREWLNANGGEKAVKAEIGRALNVIFQKDGAPDTQAIQEFQKYMNWTYAGDNPYFVRAFASMAKAFNEGTVVQGNGPSKFGQQAPGSNQRPSLADAIYPSGPRTDRYNPGSSPQSG